MSTKIFWIYLLTMTVGLYVGNRLGMQAWSSAPNPARLELITLYPWFSTAAKMEMVNTAREKGVDPKIVSEMLQRAYYWEQPFADLKEPR